MNAPSHRRFEGGPLVIASHNPGKVREIADLLQPFGTEVTSAADLGLAEPIETGTTFAANAELKARAAAEALGQLALADDSGLVVAALGGGARHSFGALGRAGQGLPGGDAKSRRRTSRQN